MTTRKQKYVFFVACDVEFFRRQFRKSKSAEVLVFEDVRKRLGSREVTKERPSDEIVRFYLTRRVNNFVKSSRTDFLYYHLDDVDERSVARIRSFDRSAGDEVTTFLMVQDPELFARLRGRVDNLLLVKKALQ